MQILRQSTQIKVRVGPFLDATDGVTPETGVTLGSADQAEALKNDGAATVDISGATWAAVTGCDGWYDLTLTTSHTDTVGLLTIVVQDSSLCTAVFKDFMVMEEATFDYLYASSAVGERGSALSTLAQGKPSATPTLAEAIMYLYWQEVYGKVVVDTNTANQKQVFADDGSTILYESNITDSSSVFTKAEVQSGA